jgi:hypothetical protein
MNEQPQDQHKWQQYYPTYIFRDRDIVLKEYETASNNVLSQERVFVNAANLLLVIATVVGSAFVAYVQFKPDLSEILRLRSLWEIENGVKAKLYTLQKDGKNTRNGK